MGKSIITNAFKSVQTVMIKHGPEFLTGIGVAGMIGTTIMAVKATPKAIKLLEKEKEETHCDKIHPVEVVKITWKFYIPAVVTCVASAACLIKANSINTRRNAALVAAYNLSKTALSEYKEKVIETIGEKKEQDVMNRIAKDKIEKDPVSKREVIVTDKGTTLCYDALFGRYFMSDMDTIRKAVNSINRAIVAGDMYVSLNEFYSEIGLSHVEIGDQLGWNIDDGEIEIFFSSQLAENGAPCLVINYNIAPKYDYYKYI